MAGTKCGTTTCNNMASAVVHWPGREPLPMCEPCTTRAIGIGAAMGCTISTTPLPLSEPTIADRTALVAAARKSAVLSEEERQSILAGAITGDGSQLIAYVENLCTDRCAAGILMATRWFEAQIDTLPEAGT